MEQLDEVLAGKINELDEMSVTDERFKDAANAVCNLVDTNNKVKNQDAELQHKKRDGFWSKILLVLTGILVPIGLKLLDQKHYDECLDKTFEYEKTGAVMSSGGRSVLGGLRIRK